MKTRSIFLIVAASIGASLFLGPATAFCADKAELLIFYSPSCRQCLNVKYKTVPRLKEHFKSSVEFVYKDLSETENFKLLLRLRREHDPVLKIKVPLYYLNGSFYRGHSTDELSLRRFINANFSSRPAEPARPSHTDDIYDVFRSFAPWAVISAGAIDGINPCAFTVILFFLSFLSLQGYRKREVAAVGIFFILAVFLTYFLIGMGLLGFFYRLRSFSLISSAFNIVVGAASIALGLFTLYDIARIIFKKDTEGFILQLPAAVKSRIQRIIGAHYRKDRDAAAGRRGLSALMCASFVTGFLVSLLEAVCTGQIYFPTVAFIIKNTPYKLQGVALIFLYNLMFILPMAAIFLVVLAGVNSATAARLFRKYLLQVKMLMAALFLGLGIILIRGI